MQNHHLFNNVPKSVKFPAMNVFLLIAGIAVGGWFVFILLIKGFAALLKKSALEATLKLLSGEEILRITDNASFLGADFPGPNLPPRTSGVLAVTDRKIFFLPWFPRKSISLPYEWVNGVRLQASFDDMASSIPCVVVRVKELKDPEGSIAWLVHEPRKWEKAIERRVNSSA
ncbi:MAG TPA: hypothetical protein ENH32_09850 [Proteobacteria bacterium]|nr:hypothetical protein [Pseudomonadota bacterium]